MVAVIALFSWNDFHSKKGEKKYQILEKYHLYIVLSKGDQIVKYFSVKCLLGIAIEDNYSMQTCKIDGISQSSPLPQEIRIIRACHKVKYSGTEGKVHNFLVHTILVLSLIHI